MKWACGGVTGTLIELALIRCGPRDRASVETRPWFGDRNGMSRGFGMWRPGVRQRLMVRHSAPVQPRLTHLMERNLWYTISHTYSHASHRSEPQLLIFLRLLLLISCWQVSIVCYQASTLYKIIAAHERGKHNILTSKFATRQSKYCSDVLLNRLFYALANCLYYARGQGKEGVNRV